MFESYRDHNLDALLRLNTGLTQHVKTYQDTDKYNTSVIDLQLAFGLSQLVNNKLAVQLNSDNNVHSRTHTAYKLAQFYYENQNPVDAIRILDLILGDTKKDNISDVEHLRALAYIRVGKFKAAAEILNNIPTSNDYEEYIRYNQGIALIQSGDEEKGASILSSLGQIKTNTPELLALIDKANLKLGYLYLETGKPEQANNFFKRIRLEGPFSNKALLGSGWTEFTLDQIDRALVPWSILHENTILDDTVIEAKMALPYAYAKLGAHGKAANLYGHAIEIIESEITRLDASISAIRNGELTQIILDEFGIQDKNWLVDLTYRPGLKKYSLPLLYSSSQFQLLAKNLHDLSLINNSLGQSLTSISAYNEFVQIKKKHYASIMPETENDIHIIYNKINNIMELANQKPAMQNDDQELQAEIDKLKHTYSDYLAFRKAEVKYYQQLPGLADQLPVLSNQLLLLNNKLNEVLTSTGEKIESIAIEILGQKIKRLQSYRVDALFALAESYDFATRKQK